MTMIVVMLIGIGTIFIASALDCSDIKTTFENIVGGKTIDWTGGNCSQGPSVGGPVLPGQKCPPGTTNIAGICQPNPHNCKPGEVWLEAVGKCVPISIN